MDPAERHEPASIHTGGLLRATTVGLAVLMAVLAALALAWHRWPETAPPLPAAARPPAPRLQRNAPAELAATRREQLERLARYAWLDRAHSQAQIPIERAMALEAANGSSDGATGNGR
jgi:hypothetical protein